MPQNEPKDIARDVVSLLIASLAADTHSTSSIHDQLSNATSEKKFGECLKAYSSDRQGHIKKVLLTLHFMFPHELLPALDILDRQLVTRFTFQPSNVDPQEQIMLHNESHPVYRNTTEPYVQNTLSYAATVDTSGINVARSYSHEVYYVRSASGLATDPSTSSLTPGRHPGRFRNVYTLSGIQYEVHLDGWNCTCPAFSLSRLKAILSDGDNGAAEDQHVEDALPPSATEAPTIAMDLSRDESNRADQLHNSLRSEWEFGGSTTKSKTAVPICKHILAVLLARTVPVLFESHLAPSTAMEIAGRAAGWYEK